MSNAIANELLPLADLVAHIPAPVRYSRVWRWAVVGVYGVKLEHHRIGGRLFSSVSAVNKFMERVNAVAGNTVALAAL